MAYVEVDHVFLNLLRDRLTDGVKLVDRYIEARNEWYSYQDGYNEAHKKFEDVRREIADALLQVAQDVNRVEQHTKGEAW